MKKIISAVLFTSISLIAADNAKVVKSDGFEPTNGAEIYQQHCSLCHGTDGRKVPAGASSILAGRDAEKLARTIKAYRDQDSRLGMYDMHKSSELMQQETVEFSDSQIGAIAKYISELE